MPSTPPRLWGIQLLLETPAGTRWGQESGPALPPHSNSATPEAETPPPWSSDVKQLEIWGAGVDDEGVRHSHHTGQQ